LAAYFKVSLVLHSARYLSSPPTPLGENVAQGFFVLRGFMNEIWKDIPNYEGRYQVSDLGNVRSLDRLSKIRLETDKRRRYFVKGKLLNVTVLQSGHCFVRLEGSFYYVHHLVLLTFVSLKPIHPDSLRIECLHADGNPKNNCVLNLSWGTVKENRADRRLLHESGKFTYEEALTIKRLISEGLSNIAIAAIFKVNRSTIYKLKKGATYAHVVY